MSQKNRRECPAVGRSITSIECAENRIVHYKCPEDCEYNPWSAENYDEVMRISKALHQKIHQRLVATERRALREFVWAGQNEDEIDVELKQDAILFFDKDESGRTFVERWLAQGAGGLRENERLCLNSIQSTMRMALIEVGTVANDRLVQAWDLLDSPARELRICDRNFASTACRFDVVFMLVHDLPHYSRVYGICCGQERHASLSPREVTKQFLSFLGGPSLDKHPGEARQWIRRNFVALDAGMQAMERLSKIEQMPVAVSFPEFEYKLKGDLAGWIKRPNWEPEVPEEEDAAQGVSSRYVIFKKSADEDFASGEDMRPFSRAILGTFYVQKGRAYLACMSKGGEERLRAEFVEQAGPIAVFKKSRVIKEEFTGGASQKELRRLRSMVPPGLRPKRGEQAIETSRIDIPPGQTHEEFELAHRQTLLRDLVTKHVPMLGNKPAKEAAADSRLRPLAVHWLKGQIQAWDRFILESGMSGDINWLVRELGIPELDIPAPPPRKRVSFDVE